MRRPSARARGASAAAANDARLLRELSAAWRLINQTHFRGALVAPTLEVVASAGTLGRWLPATRTLEISRPLVEGQPWTVTLEVLKHEMAHQYVHEVLREESEAPHGRAVREACARLGIDAKAAGLPAGAPAEEDKVVGRIARLLALADSPNRHEAEAAAAAAARLMLKHNIEAERAHVDRRYGFAHLGVPTGRISEHERLVAMILGKFFFVEVIWVPVYRPREGRRGSVLEICGTAANLAMAEYVYGFLLATADRLWAEAKQESGLASDRERNRFRAGVMAGFADKLDRQAARSRSEGLVWVRDGDLSAYLRLRYPQVRNVRYAGQRRTEAWARGRQAGRQIVLSRPVHAAPTSRGRLLKP